MRYADKIAVVVYMALSALWVYWVLDRQLTFGSELGDWVMIVLSRPPTSRSAS